MAWLGQVGLVGPEVGASLLAILHFTFHEGLASGIPLGIRLTFFQIR